MRSPFASLTRPSRRSASDLIRILRSCEIFSGCCQPPACRQTNGLRRGPSHASRAAHDAVLDERNGARVEEASARTDSIANGGVGSVEGVTRAREREGFASPGTRKTVNSRGRRTPVAMGGQAAWITEGIATQDASTLTGVRQYEVRVRARARPLFARGVRGGAFPSASLRSREGTSGSRRIVRERPCAPSPDSALPSVSRTPQQLSALNLTHLEVRSPRVSAIRPCSSVSPRPFPRPLPPSTCPQPFESDKLSRLPPLASAVPARPRRDHHAQRRVHASRDGA